MKRFSILLSVCLAMVGCGDDDVGTVPVDMSRADMNTSADMSVADLSVGDLGRADMNVPDLGPPPTTYSGSITLLETKLLNPGMTGTFFGQGIQAGITFHASTDLPGPVLEATPGSPLGCKAWEYTAAQAVIASIGNDEGAVQITSGAGTSPPTFPACSFVAGAGYSCPQPTTAGTGGIIATGPMAGTATLTDVATTYTAATTTNRYVRISGATNAGNNGAFPILALVGGNTLVYGNPAVVGETLPAAATHINLAAVGPTPSAPDPGFLSNDNTMDFALTPGGGSHFTAFTLTTGSGTVGDDFTLDSAAKNLLNNIPLDGTAFTVGCEAGSCATGSASGVILNIVTTDAPITGLSPFAMPLPATRRVVVRCAGLATTSMTIPAAYSALLMGSGATRVQATFIRPTLMTGGGTVTGVSGHAIVGFTTRTTP